MKVPALGFDRALGLFVICELAYVVAARLVYFGYTGSEIRKELYWTAIRLVSAVLMFWFFKRVIRPEGGAPGRMTARSWLAAGIFLVPVLVANEGLKSPDRYVFAATSLVVGIREELAYRGILQTLLIRKLGVAGGLLASNAVFVFYHYGVQSFEILNVLQLFFVGMILGLSYYVTRSLLFVIALHTIYDAIWCFTPMLHPPLPEIVGTCILVVTLLALSMNLKTAVETTDSTDGHGLPRH